MVENITYFLVGYVLGTSTVLTVIFWNKLINNLVDFFTFKRLKYKLKMWWWSTKFFFKYKVLRK